MKTQKIISLLLVITIIAVLASSTIYVSAEENEVLYLETGEGNIDSGDPILYYENETSIVYDNLPSSVDLSNSQYFPCIRTQGEVGSCAAWATTYYQFGYQVAKMNGWNAKNDPSKQFSPKYTYNYVNDGSNDGSSMKDNAEILKCQGAVRFSELTPSEYATSAELTEWCTNTNYQKEALTNRVSEFNYQSFANYTNTQTPISSTNSDYLNKMKHLLSTDHVLSFSTTIGRLEPKTINGITFNGSKYWNYGLLDNDEICCVGVNVYETYSYTHAMTIVGYDDTIWYDYNNNGNVEDFELGAFKVANSWGTKYCNNGFVWVMYDALNRQSNYSVMNVSGRQPVIRFYQFNYIEVENCEVELYAEVSLEQYRRSDIQLKLGINSVMSSNTASFTEDTLFNCQGGDCMLGGLGSNISTATFVFDFGTLIDGPRNRKSYFVITKDCVANQDTNINSVVIKDRIDEVITDSNIVSLSHNQTDNRKYRIGLLGDVDNDCYVDIFDATNIQRYLASLTELTADDEKVADVDNDNYISVIDSTYIQRYLAGIDDHLPGGIYKNLD